MKQIVSLVDKFGFLKYEVERAYCKKNKLVQGYFLDWLAPEEQSHAVAYANKHPKVIEEMIMKNTIEVKYS